jgi:hypothetical protein
MKNNLYFIMTILASILSTSLLLLGVLLNITFVYCLGAVTSLVASATLLDALMLRREGKL